MQVLLRCYSLTMLLVSGCKTKLNANAKNRETKIVAILITLLALSCRASINAETTSSTRSTPTCDKHITTCDTAGSESDKSSIQNVDEEEETVATEKEETVATEEEVSRTFKGV